METESASLPSLQLQLGNRKMTRTQNHVSSLSARSIGFLFPNCQERQLKQISAHKLGIGNRTKKRPDQTQTYKRNTFCMLCMRTEGTSLEALI